MTKEKHDCMAMRTVANLKRDTVSIEANDKQKRDALVLVLTDMGYRTWVRRTPLSGVTEVCFHNISPSVYP